MTKITSGPEKLIDYRGRVEFLQATTNEMSPAPIDTLLELLPVFRSWHAHFDNLDENQIAVDIMKAMAITNYAIGDPDTSREAIALQQAISAWMAKHRFSSTDQWIAKAAFCTLLVHAGHSGHAGRVAERGWYLRDPGEELRPDTNVIVPWTSDETHDDHLKRFDAEYRRVRKEFKRLVALHLGLRKGLQSARWTAIRFTVRTFTDVTRIVNRDEDTVRKAITAFTRRTGLTLPT